MSFLSPIFLLGLPLLAVPIIIHLLSKRQRRIIDWGAMRFLINAATRRRRLWRLTDLLLLLLRTLAILFFISALARPLLPVNWLGGSGPKEVILILDQSLSTARQVNGTSLFELEIRKANALLDQLDQNDSIRVLLAGQSPEWLTSDPRPASPGTVRALRGQLDQLKPTLGSASLASCLREALELEIPEDKIARVIAVITDDQGYGWQRDEEGLWAALQARREALPLPASVNVYFVAPPDPPLDNLAVDKLEAARAAAAVDQPVVLKASVRNHGTNRSPASVLSWQSGEEFLGITSIPELEPGADTSISINHIFTSPGVAEVSCRLSGQDALEPDNSARFLLDVREAMPVLVVQENSFADPLKTETGYLLAALGIGSGSRPGQPWRSVFQPTVIETAALESVDLSEYRCVLLANVPRVSQAALKRLTAYVEAGGGLWIALGDQTDPDFHNGSLYEEGLGLAPMQIRNAAGDAANHDVFFNVSPPSETHPATALLSDTARLDLDRVRLYRRWLFNTVSARDVSLLLRVQDGDPVAAEKSVGRGRVIMLGVPLGVAWSNLPLSQAYVALLHEWLWYLAEPSLPRRNLEVGAMIRETALRSEQIDSAILERPDDQTIELTPRTVEGQTCLDYLGTRLPGQYTMIVQKEKRELRRTHFVVQRDARESNLQPLANTEREKLSAIKGFRLDPPSLAPPSDRKLEMPRHPLEGWLLAFLAGVFLMEIALAGWSTHRRRQSTAPVSMTA